jgi:multiple sugar transport system substrate-binding protein
MSWSKKAFLVLMTLILVFFAAACGSNNNSSAGSGTTSSGSSSSSSSGSSGGSGDSGSGPAADDGKPFAGSTIRFVAANHAWTDTIKPLIPKFEEETGIKVEFEQFFEDQLTQKLTVELTAGSDSLDVFMIRPLQDGKLYIKNGWLADITDYAQDPEWDFSDFAAGAVAPFQQDSRLYGVPLITEREILYYRKDIFEQNNIKVPETLEELKAVAAQLNDPKNEFYGFVARGQRSPAVTQFSSFLYSSGGDWFADGQATLDTAEAIEAFTLYGDLLREYGPPGVLNMSWPQALGVFAQGKAAMYTDADSLFANMLDPEKSIVPEENIGFAVFPAGKAGQKPYNVTAWGLGINSKSKVQDAAWEFIKWITNKENSLAIQGAGNPGARQSAWDNPEGVKAFSAELAEVMSKSSAIGQGYDRPLVISVGEARDIIGEVIVTSITGGDVAGAAKSANAKFQELLDKEK